MCNGIVIGLSLVILKGFRVLLLLKFSRMTLISNNAHLLILTMRELPIATIRIEY